MKSKLNNSEKIPSSINFSQDSCAFNGCGFPIHGKPTTRRALVNKKFLQRWALSEQATAHQPFKNEPTYLPSQQRRRAHAAPAGLEDARSRDDNAGAAEGETLFNGSCASAFSLSESSCGVIGSPLVHTTESVSQLPVNQIWGVLDPKTQQIQRVRFDEKFREYRPIANPDDVRLERHLLLNAAAKILHATPHPRGNDKRWRTTFCSRHICKLADNVKVLLGKEHHRAHFANLMRCGSIWTCPLCATRICHKREQEIRNAFDKRTASGEFAYMITLTFSHCKQDVLAQLLDSREGRRGLRYALHILRSSKTYCCLKDKIDFRQLIRSIEVTHSMANGWHPHVHELWFCGKKLTLNELALAKKMLFAAWHAACSKAGLSLPNRKHGIDIVRAYSPSEYLQKWGRAQGWGGGAELTKSHLKHSKNRSGYGPFDFLRLYRQGGPLAGFYAKLFAEFATAFFGVRQCYWSRGFKKLCGIGEISDEEIMALEEEPAEVITLIDRDTWKLVLKQKRELRPKILELAENGGTVAVESFLAEIRSSELAQDRVLTIGSVNLDVGLAVGSSHLDDGLGLGRSFGEVADFVSKKTKQPVSPG